MGLEEGHVEEGEDVPLVAEVRVVLLVDSGEGVAGAAPDADGDAVLGPGPVLAGGERAAGDGGLEAAAGRVEVPAARADDRRAVGDVLPAAVVRVVDIVAERPLEGRGPRPAEERVREDLGRREDEVDLFI